MELTKYKIEIEWENCNKVKRRNIFIFYSKQRRFAFALFYHP